MKHLMLLMLLCSSAALYAQQTITGTVTDKTTGQPLEGVSMIIDGNTASGVHTNASGRYQLTAPGKGAYRLQASYLGYRTYTTTLQAGQAPGQLNIALEETGLFVEPVEISSLRGGKHAPFTRSTLDAADIKQQNLGQDLPVLLNQLPGVVTSSDAGNGIGYTGMRVRGSDITRINVTVNGIPINDAESQGTFFVNMPDFASSVSSIQLQRGVGTSTNGAGAFGATLNLSTNEFRDKAYGETSNSYGSFNSWKHTIKAGSGLINDHFTVDARLSKISSDGYIDRASSDLRSFYTSAAYISKKTAIRLNVFSGKEKTYQAWNGVPEALLKTDRTYNSAGTEKPGEPYDNETDNYQQDHYQLFLNQEINAHLNFNVALHYTRGRGYYEQYKAQELFTGYGLTPPVINGQPVDTTDLVRQLWLDNYFYGTVFSVNSTGHRLNWSLGGGWNRYDGEHYGKIIWAQYDIDKDHKYYDLDAFKTDLNIYWKGEASITDALHLFADLQYRTVRYNIDGFRNNPSLIQHNTYHFFNPKAGLYYYLDDRSRVYASFAIGNKEPNRDDFEAGLEQTPQHETLRNVEAGYVLRSNRLNLQANAYYMNYKNQLVQTGKLNDVGAYTRTNIPKSYRVGIELQGSVRLNSVFSLAVNAAFSRNKVQDYTAYIDNYDAGKQDTISYGDQDIAFSPNVVAGYTLTVTPVKNLRLDVLGKYTGRQYLDNTGSKARSLDAYYVNDVRALYTIPQRLFRELSLQVMVNNVFNKKYEPNGATYTWIADGQVVSDNYYYPMAGTNYLVGLTVGF
ncbi:TonB-dependent receptor [Chitinophaga japonensis]|uniref:Iron complex outermembrane receptor protein n=1 Tax=Chitinophaga japonensis TaxID=104662 RepID=A0A562SLC3_CHIJA|nr:TonB-dependent receptor [Chitinophaga japonensis]TWI82091.1 iron complex outermembrane receptor protein [Chitinophaga japonensis]